MFYYLYYLLNNIWQ